MTNATVAADASALTWVGDMTSNDTEHFFNNRMFRYPPGLISGQRGSAAALSLCAVNVPECENGEWRGEGLRVASVVCCVVALVYISSR